MPVLLSLWSQIPGRMSKHKSIFPFWRELQSFSVVTTVRGHLQVCFLVRGKVWFYKEEGFWRELNVHNSATNWLKEGLEHDSVLHAQTQTTHQENPEIHRWYRQQFSFKFHDSPRLSKDPLHDALATLAARISAAAWVKVQGVRGWVTQH